MKKSTILIVFLLFTIHSLYSQVEVRKFGVVSLDELKLAVYEKDPEAEAVVLFDEGESFFYYVGQSYDIRFTRTKRIKILDKSGIKHAEVSIPYYVNGRGQTEIVRSIKAYTYNYENGKTVKKELDKKTIYEEKINNRWRAKKFVFPDVKVGSIIEYKFILETPFHFNLPDWEFQSRIPTIYSKYTVRMIPFYEYIYLVKGISKFSYQKSEPNTGLKRDYFGVKFNDMVNTYVLEDVPAFKDASFITSKDDYIIKMDFQLSKINNPTGGSREIITTWKKLNTALLKHDKFGKYIKRSERFAKQLLEEKININGKETKEKIKIIIEYMKSNFRWNGYYSKYTSKSPKELLNQKTGNSADINLFLIAILKSAEIEVKPVILSTRNNGKIRTNYPFDHHFNYVIPLVSAGEIDFLVDATESKMSYARIPKRCINGKGLVVDKEFVLWVNLYNGVASINNKVITININPKDLQATSIVSIQSTEFESLNYKTLFGNDTARIRTEFLKDRFTHISQVSTFNYNRKEKPYVISIKGKIDIENIDNKLIISPFMGFPIQENKLTQKERNYPVDFVFKKTEGFKSDISIPSGYKILSIPNNFKLNDQLVHINLAFKQNGNMVEASGSYTFKKAIYQKNEYPELKSRLDIIVTKFNEEIVFEEL